MRIVSIEHFAVLTYKRLIAGAKKGKKTLKR